MHLIMKYIPTDENRIVFAGKREENGERKGFCEPEHKKPRRRCKIFYSNDLANTLFLEVFRH